MSQVSVGEYPQYLGDVQLGHLPTPASADGHHFMANYFNHVTIDLYLMV